jgi:hypothetical protein
MEKQKIKDIRGRLFQLTIGKDCYLILLCRKDLCVISTPRFRGDELVPADAGAEKSGLEMLSSRWLAPLHADFSTPPPAADSLEMTSFCWFLQSNLI